MFLHIFFDISHFLRYEGWQYLLETELETELKFELSKVTGCGSESALCFSWCPSFLAPWSGRYPSCPQTCPPRFLIPHCLDTITADFMMPLSLVNSVTKRSLKCVDYSLIPRYQSLRQRYTHPFWLNFLPLNNSWSFSTITSGTHSYQLNLLILNRLPKSPFCFFALIWLSTSELGPLWSP